MPRLDNWYIYGPCLVGQVYNDEKGRFEDGMQILTSSVLELNWKDGYCQTKNTKYQLGPMANMLKLLTDGIMIHGAEDVNPSEDTKPGA